MKLILSALMFAAFLSPARAADIPAGLTAEVKVGTTVEGREVVGEAASFGPETESVVAWCRVTGSQQPTEIFHVWKRNGEEVSRVALKVNSASYRTHSRKSVKGLVGNWSVEVQDGAQAVLATATFDVKN